MVFIIVLLQMVYTSFGCTKFQNDSVQIYSTQYELRKLRYEDLFIDRDFSNVTLIDQSKILSYIFPIKLLEQVNIDSTQIEAIDILLQDLSYEWTNKFTALIKNDQKYKISLSNQVNQGQHSRIPQFDKLSSDLQADQCYDLAYLSSKTIAVDCIYVEENGGIQNVMFIWNDETQTFTKSENENLMGYTSAVKRKLLAANKQLFRASLYNEDQQQFESILEVFNKDGVLQYYFDSNVLRYLAVNTKKLQIIDFRVSTVGQIAILNYDGCILILDYSQRETEWNLLHEFKHGESAKAFDFNFKQGTYVIYLGDKILFQSIKDQFQLTLDIKIDKIYMTESLIYTLTLNQKIMTYDFQLNSIASIDVQKLKFILNDYTSDDIIVINESNTERYLLIKQPYLVYKSDLINEDTQVSQLIQNLPNNNKCVLQIYHSTLSTVEERVIISNLHPNIIDGEIPTYPQNAQLQINHKAIYGQNLQISFNNISNSLLKLNIKSKKIDQYIIQIQKSNDSLTFFNVDQIESEYLFTKQFNNEWVQYTYCSIENSTCQIFEVMLKIDHLRKNNSCVWSTSKTAFLASPQTNQLDVFTITNKKIYVFSISLAYLIDQIQISKEVLLALSIVNSTIVTYYSSSISLTQLFEINPQSIGALGVKQWAPSGIHANQYSTKVFIRNQDDTQIIILSCSLIGFSIVDILTFDSENKVQDILIFENHFALMINNKYLIYDMTKKEDIHLVRYLDLFGYKTTSQTLYTYQGWIYMVSDDKLLVYNINKINFNSLWHVIDNFEKQFLIAFENKLFIKEDTLIQLYEEIQLYSNCQIQNENFITQFKMTSYIKNKKQNVILSSNESILNSQSQVQLNSEKLIITTKLSKKYQDFCDKISNDWIQNSIVTNIDVKCRDCNNEIKVIQQLQLYMSNYYEAGLDIKELDQNQLIILYQRKFIIFQKSNKQIVQEIHFDHTCTQILYQSTNKIILKCIIQETISLIQWRYKNPTYEVDNEVLNINKELLKIVLIDQNLILIEKFQITIFDCQNDNFKFNECHEQKKIELPGYYLNFIEYQSFYYIYYYDFQLNIVPINLKYTYSQIEQEKYTVDINQIISNHGFEKLYEEWLNLHIISLKQVGYIMTQEILFISQRYLHFQITIELNSKQKQIQLTKNLIIFQKYVDWVAVKSISYKQKVIIQYQKDEQSILTLYKSLDQEVVTQIGGIKVRNDQNFNFDIINESNQIFLYSTENQESNFYNKYQLNDDLLLCINGKIENQNIDFNVSNDFSYQIQSLNLDVTYDYFTFWQIWVLIVVILICFGIGYVFWKKRQNQKKKKSYLLDENVVLN